MQLLDSRGKPLPSSAHHRERQQREAMRVNFYRRLNAKYDAAKTTDENERHWANADLLSANAAHRPAIRRRIRMRARYEAQENNSYAKGMILTLANDLVGTGPRLQLMTADKPANRRVQALFDDWARETRLAEKLRTMRMAKCVDGETYALFTNNPTLTSPVKLDLRPVEADQFDPPWEAQLRPEEEEVDGIRFDRYGNPQSYYMLREHPGSLLQLNAQRGDWVKAQHVAHWYRVDRPGQKHGVSEIATSLPLFAMLRRFTLATLAAAETAADYAGVMHTNANASCDTEELAEDDWFEAIPLEYRALLTLPQGWTMSQLKAEHPATTYEMFKREVINEIARCLNMPYNVAAANSASYNYASGRMDHQVYFRSIDVERHSLECCILDRILYAWFAEARLIPGLLPQVRTPIAEWKWQWFWDSPEHVDPGKNATANKLGLEGGFTHRVRLYQRQGLDIDVEDAAAAESYGVTVAAYRQALFTRHLTTSADVATSDDPENDNADEDATAATDDRFSAAVA